MWGIVYLCLGLPEPPKDKLINLTLSFYIDRTFGAGGQKKLTVMDKQKLAKAVVAISLAIPLSSIVYSVISILLTLRSHLL